MTEPGLRRHPWSVLSCNGLAQASASAAMAAALARLAEAVAAAVRLAAPLPEGRGYQLMRRPQANPAGVHEGLQTGLQAAAAWARTTELAR